MANHRIRLIKNARLPLIKREFKIQTQPKSSKSDDFILEEYRQCFDSKKHYDNLLWTIATITLVVVGPLVIFLTERATSISIFNSLSLRFIGTLLVVVFFFVYERNRFWSEVANERAREIERNFEHRDGLAIQFMLSAITKMVILKNVDSAGKQIENEKSEKTHIKMHCLIRMLMLLLVAAIWIVGWC